MLRLRAARLETLIPPRASSSRVFVSMGTLRDLSEVLAYRNDEVVYRFAEDHGIALGDAEEIFLETKRWLWLCAAEPDAKIPLLSEARAIDEMWHTFLLFTDAYARFCETYLGFFVHHFPRTRAEKEAWEKEVAADGEAALVKRRVLLRAAYETICDRLGTATLKKWCEEFPARFSFSETARGNRQVPPSTS